MAFKPKNTGGGGGGQFEDTSKLPVPKSGNRKARVSLIVDLGEQKREDFEDPNTGELKPQKDCQQVVVFVDLVNDVVDYGGKIGKQQYRMLLNKTFQGVLSGINFALTPPKDAKGNTIMGKPWQLHPANMLTKLAKAVDKEEIIYDDRKNPNSLDISLLLNEPFMCQVEVKETPHKEGKKNADGELIVYRNVNFKGASAVPLDDDDNPIHVAELTQPARCVTFDNATVDDIQFIRPSIIKVIKKANDYEGSQMQEAIEAYEAANAGSSGEEEEEEKPAEKPKAKPAAKPAAPKKKPASAPVEDDGIDDDIPF